MFVAAVALGLAGLVPAGSGLSHTSQVAGLQVIHPWTEPGERGGTSKAYPTFVNQSNGRQVIAGVSTEVAERVEIVARGQGVERLELAPGETLGVDQFHLRLIDLTRDLDDGGHFAATLTLADGRRAEIMMVVGESSQAPDM
jgi:copper(I)-binding protein